MLGIVPGNRFKTTDSSDEDTVQNLPISSKISNRNSSRSESLANPPTKSSFIKRFSSFRRSQKNDVATSGHTRSPSLSKSNSKKAANYTIGKLPAKYIQTTDVKKETLNPVWNQKFRL